MLPITLNTTTIRRTDDGLISITDLYQAACASGQAEGKRNPGDWAREAGAQFIDFVAENLHTRKTGIYKTSKARADRGGGTYAHWQIALAYAKYLSPELHMQINDVYMRAKSGDVTLADEIADKATPEQQQWLAKRVQGKVIRHRFTSTLNDHGVTGKGFADCTNAIYRPILGGKKSEVCRANGIPYKPSISMRDAMSIDQLIATSMAEMVSAKKIEKFNIRGNANCALECDRAAQQVASLMY